MCRLCTHKLLPFIFVSDLDAISRPFAQARWISILGDIPSEMLHRGKLYHKYFTKDGRLFELEQPQFDDEDEDEDIEDSAGRSRGGYRNGSDVPGFNILHPKKSSLRHRSHTDDELFLDFVQQLLSYDPKDRYVLQCSLAMLLLPAQ